MPYIAHENEPWYPYGYITKERPYQDQRPRLPPPYFTQGYAFYQSWMNDWMRDLERENKRHWDMMSKFNHRKLFKPVQYMGSHRVPIYYNFTEFKQKANKYAARKRKAILAKIEQNRQQVIRKRIELNRQKAIQRRKFIVARKLNKY